MLEVAVIGAGASALAASRHLIGQGLRPSIFEAAKTLGGAWSSVTPNNDDSDNDDNHHSSSSPHTTSKMWNGLTTNLSKHTCRFSEWPWPDGTPTFPSAVDMGRYLEGYADHFLDHSCFLYQCQVTNIESLNTGNNSPGYRVEWTDLSTATKHAKDFEGVVVATGFFSRPHLPKGVMGDYWNKTPTMRDRIIHASDYDSPAAFTDQAVMVVGASFSALEIAVDLATTAKRVVHVLPSERIPWVLPRYIPHLSEDTDDDETVSSSNKMTTSILPVDLALYQRNKDAPQLPEMIQMTPDMSKARHEFMYSMVGKRQEESSLGIPNNWEEEPPLVAISDFYLDMIVQGDIEVVHGRFQGLSADDPNNSKDDDDDDDDDNTTPPTWCIESPTGQPIYMKDIDKVICATGYESNLQDYLHPDILQTLEYDPTDLFCPMTTCWDSLHPQLPNLFFCGMYRGPYMGIMELQGRLAAGVLSGNVQLDEASMDHALEQSRQIRNQKPRPQFPHFDYLGYMDTLTNVALQSKDFPRMNLQKGDMVSPAFYQSTDDQLAVTEAEELKQHISRGKDGSRIPSIVLSAIIGEWNFDRRIVHFDNDRQEHVYGTVKYSRPALDHVLYREDGFYELSPTKTLNVFREYEYQVTGDCLELYFVELGERAHLFLSLKFSKQEGGRDYWVATSDHLCIKDLYKARFEIYLDGLAATHLQITYRVKGPTKDYESTTILTPKTAKTPVGVM